MRQKVSSTKAQATRVEVAMRREMPGCATRAARSRLLAATRAGAMAIATSGISMRKAYRTKSAVAIWPTAIPYRKRTIQGSAICGAASGTG